MRKWFVFVTMLCLLAPLAFGQVMLNEILYDTIGDDDTSIMYTEIYGPAGTDLTGWTIVGINGNGGAPYLTITLSGSIPADGYFVVGGSAAQNVDQVLAHDWQNAGSATGVSCDGIDLRNAGGTTVDHLCYGECDSDDTCDGEGGSNAPDPFAGGGVNRPVARIPDHSDTNVNGTDWSSSDVQSPGAPNSGEPCDPVTAILEDIRENDDQGVPALNGEFVIVQGIVNVNNYVMDDSLSNFFIQDDNAGVNVFGGGVPQGIMEGDCVEVSGWVSQFNGLTEIVSTGSGNCVFSVEVLEGPGTPAALTLTGASSFEAFEGMLAEIHNVTIVSGTWPTPGNNASLTVTDGNGTIILRIDRDTQVPTVPQPTGPFTVRGIISQFDDTAPYTAEYQITPRYTTDILPGTAVGDDPISIAESFKLLESYPNPFNGTANIELAVGSAREIVVTITDVLGREVYSRALTNLTPGNHRLQWSPTGAAGLYFLRAQGGANVQTSKLLYLK